MTVPRRSTDTEVEFYVYGGTNGGTYAFSIVNAGKLNRIGGGRLPKTGSIAAGKSFRYKVRYDALQASGSEGDIIAKAEFTEFGTGQRLSDETATLTAVKVELVVVAEAPENVCVHRHKYGVRELVTPILTPCVEASWIFSFDANSDDSGKLQCPIHAATNPFEIRYGGGAYSPAVNVIQPNGIEGINPFVETYGVPFGCAGGIGLAMQFRVLPVDVSFSQIAIEEVPSSAGNHSGYFANPYFSGEWCHSRQTGAGRWADVDVNNVVGGHDGYFDHAALVVALPRMTSGGVITDDPTESWIEGYNVWTFPFGWNVLGTKGFSEPYACFASGTTQEFTIDGLGTAGVRKLGYSVRREIFGTIYLDSDGGLSDE